MTDTTLPEFERDWRARLVSLLVPESAPAAADVGINLTMDGNIEYEGEPDQSTALYLNVSVSGYDESGNRLWSYDREYEGAAAPMALLADMAKAKQPGTDMSKAQGPTDCDQCDGTVTEHESYCTRGR